MLQQRTRIHLSPERDRPLRELYGACHVPAEGDPDDVWWLGFDRAHLHELSRGSTFPPLAGAKYRDISFAKGTIADRAEECARAGRNDVSDLSLM